MELRISKFLVSSLFCSSLFYSFRQCSLRQFSFRKCSLRSLCFLFCLCFCSCAYLGSLEDSEQSSQTKNNASSNQSKQVEAEEGRAALKSNISAAQSSEITDIYLTSPGRSDFITISKGGEVTLRAGTGDPMNGHTLLRLEPGYTATAFSAKNQILAASYAGRIELYDLVSAQKKESLERIDTRMVSMEFSPKGDSLIMGGADAIIYHWQFEFAKRAQTIKEREKILERYIGHAAVVNIVRFHPFGRVFFSSDWDGILSAWLLYRSDKYGGVYDQNIFEGRLFSEDTRRVRGVHGDDSMIEQARFSSDGELYYAADESGTIEIWQTRGFKKVLSHSAHKGKIYDLAVSREGERLATLGRDGKLKIWKIEISEGDAPGSKVYSLIIGKELDDQSGRRIIFQDSGRLVSAGLDGRIQIYTVE